MHHARNIASLLSASAGEAVDEALRARCCRLLVAYGWAAKAHARWEPPPVDVLTALLGPDEAQRTAEARKPTLHVLSLLRRTVQPLELPVAVSMEIQSSISQLSLVFGGMERLMSTPLSPTCKLMPLHPVNLIARSYALPNTRRSHAHASRFARPTDMRHTSRGLLLWLALLPSGLLGAGCTTLPKLLLVVLTTAYIMLGIDEIGIQIEQPFDILPLHALATVLTRDVEDQLCKW